MQISRKRFELETWYQIPTNRKRPMADRMKTSSMTSRDPERSRSWPQYLYGPLFQNWLEIETRLQWGTYWKWHTRNKTVTWPMTSRDPERWKSWPSCIKMQISQNVLRYRLGTKFQLIGNGLWWIEWWRHQWRDMTLKGQCRNPDNFRAHYLEHSLRYRLGYYGASTGNF